MSTFLFYFSLILLILSGCYCLWMFFFMVCGLFIKPKIYPEATGLMRFAIIICARNEEKVIANLIRSLKQQDYPQDRFEIFTVAHNCTDQTAEAAKAAGSKVLIRNCPEETHKGDALNFALTRIAEHEADNFDAFMVFDADNLVSPAFLKEVNKGFATGADVVQGFRASKNYDDNLTSRLFSCLWMGMCYSQNLPHSAFNLPVTISGTGFAAKFSALAGKGWRTKTLCEDIEFSIQQMLLGHKTVATVHGVFYDEQPTRFKPAVRQRLRWAAGIWECFTQYFSEVFRAIPKRGMCAVKTALEILLNPVLIAGSIGLVIQTGLLICQGISGDMLMKLSLLLLLSGWLLVMPVILNVMIREKLPFFENLGVVLFFPIFLFFSGVLALIVPFCPRISWKPIAHESTKSLEDLEG